MTLKDYRLLYILTCEGACGFLISEPRRAEGRRCMDGAVMEARLVTSPATMATADHTPHTDALTTMKLKIRFSSEQF